MHPITEEMRYRRIEKTIENLNRNGIEAVYAANRTEARSILRTLLPDGCSIGCGGSVTLEEIQALSLFRSENYHFFDRYAPNLTKEETEQIFRDSLTADVYVMSTNAVTEDGILYNVDGRSNRTAALLFGPKRVVIIAGYNKIVRSLPEAVLRVKTVAAPANALRLHCKTPCARTGICASLLRTDAGTMSDGCASDDRICANYVVTAKQRERGRIQVILVGEDLGF